MSQRFSLFEQIYLGKSNDISRKLRRREELIRKHKRQGFEKRSKKNLLKLALRNVPVDGRHEILGVRGINPMEYLPSDLARHLRACGSTGNLSRGQRIHRFILGSDFRESTFLAHRLVEMYGRLGYIKDAKNTFYNIKYSNTLSCNYMLSAYARNGDTTSSKRLFDSMSKRDGETWDVLVGAYACNRHLNEAKEVFDKMPEWSVIAWNDMVAVNAQTGHLVQAKVLLDEMPEMSVIAWNAVLQAYSRLGHHEEAKQLYDAMPEDLLVSWASGAKAESRMKHLEEQVRVMFDRMSDRTVSSWNAMIKAYAEDGQINEARSLFERMRAPTSASWALMVKSYAQNGYFPEAKVMFTKAPEKDVVLRVALLFVYVLAGNMEKASRIFEKRKSTAAWNNMIAGYVQLGDTKQAWKLFQKMPHPNTKVWNALLQGTVRQGVDAQSLLPNMFLMGVPANAVTFMNALDSINRLKVQRLDELITLSSNVFVCVQNDHGILPTLELYNCMVNILSRAGKLEHAEELVENMPFVPDILSWTSLLAGCKIHGHVELGIRTLKHLFLTTSEERALCKHALF